VREVTCFLAATGEPISIKVERGGFKIVGIARVTQHRAAPAGDYPNRHLLIVRLDRLISLGAQVRTVFEASSIESPMPMLAKSEICAIN